ncbi:MAG: peptidoglycan DD-metalloendopeptidase family protein [Lautropia sp.]|nr:peptidoglycan DD-metalloendopeptidase family protein [Lautropia sp.]
MKSVVPEKQSSLWLVVPVVLLMAGCAASRPAPVVNRTTPGAPAGSAPAQTDNRMSLPQGEPHPDGQGANANQAAQTEGGTTGSAQVTPVYQGAINAPGAFGSPDNPNLKVGPQGLKRPYGTPRPSLTAQAPLPAAPAMVGSAGARGAAPAASAAGANSANSSPGAGKPAAADRPPAVPSATRTFDGVRFSWPLAGSVVQPFDGVSNKGLLLAGKEGDPVQAAADGRVIFSGEGPRGYGKLIIIKHGNAMLSVYAHNRSLDVKESQQVTRGQKIAELGGGGNQRPTLHFEVRQSGKPVDPVGVLPKR